MKTLVHNSRMTSRRGFTLLELLVVVAILAAIAGTATIALKDTDARASAAAHVTMMDELNKGINTYRVLKRNELPSRFDSMLAYDGTNYVDPGCLGFDIGDGNAIAAIPTEVQQIMLDSGMAQLMYIDTTALPEGAVSGATDCTPTYIQALISSRSNNVVAGNIFMSPDANGCGEALDLDSNGDGTADAAVSGLWWTGFCTRLTGQDPSDDSAYNADGNHAYLMTGVGPSCTLFDTTTLGGMTTVPIYRHVKPNEYGRFIAVWDVGVYNSTVTSGIVTDGQPELIAIVDGALDTKEEELGEWDGTRNTI